MEARKLWKKILWFIYDEIKLEKSRNLMTVRIAQDLGLKKIINFSKKVRHLRKSQVNFYLYL